MRTIILEDFQQQLEERKAQLSIEFTPEFLESLRNQGHCCTTAKVAMLREIQRRCQEAGIEPLPASWPGSEKENS
jgi:hypothetical protein